MDDVNEYAERKAQGILNEFPRVEHVHVVLDVQKHLHIAELIVQARQRIRLEAKESSDNMRVSVDAAADKIEKQLRRLRDKVQDHKAAMRHFEGEREKRVEGSL
jgi:putative sigma-54 modulation protein